MESEGGVPSSMIATQTGSPETFINAQGTMSHEGKSANTRKRSGTPWTYKSRIVG